MEQFYNSMWQIQNVTLREDNGEQTMKGHLQKKKKWDEGERKKTCTNISWWQSQYQMKMSSRIMNLLQTIQNIV